MSTKAFHRQHRADMYRRAKLARASLPYRLSRAPGGGSSAKPKG